MSKKEDKTSQISKFVKYEVENLLKDVQISANSIYSNNVQITASNDEIFLDFFSITPIPYHQYPLVQHLQRVIIPITHGKGLATAIANVIANYEDLSGQILPNRREKDDNDKIEIWI